jgi:hypothetical protein
MLKGFILMGYFLLITNSLNSGELKAHELRQRSMLSKNGIIDMNYKDYKYFVEESPRPY